MRPPMGFFLVVLGLVTVVVLVLVLFQTVSLRNDLGAARDELAAVRAAVEEHEPGITEEDLVRRLDELEAGIRDWLIATGADGGFDDSPAGGAGGEGTVVDRLDEILNRLEGLDDRIDRICDGVPVC